FAVIGLGRFGTSIAKTLYADGHDVLAIDASAERIEAVAEFVTHAVQADATDEDALRTLGLRNFDVAVITIGGNVQSSILITLLCKEMGIHYVVAKAQNDLHAKVLYRIGADRVVFPERDMGIRVAKSLTTHNIVEMIELSEEYSLVETHVPNAWIGKTLRNLDVRVKYGINVMAIRRGTNLIASPHGDEILVAEDELVIIGETNDIAKLETM
ncbi:MAG: TrkA family potassium uptake protein, partial [Clostridia bacterium]